jgi:hypothetical protein
MQSLFVILLFFSLLMPPCLAQADTDSLKAQINANNARIDAAYAKGDLSAAAMAFRKNIDLYEKLQINKADMTKALTNYRELLKRLDRRDEAEIITRRIDELNKPKQRLVTDAQLEIAGKTFKEEYLHTGTYLVYGTLNFVNKRKLHIVPGYSRSDEPPPAIDCIYNVVVPAVGAVRVDVVWTDNGRDRNGYYLMTNEGGRLRLLGVPENSPCHGLFYLVK